LAIFKGNINGTSFGRVVYDRYIYNAPPVTLSEDVGTLKPAPLPVTIKDAIDGHIIEGE
jgi:hypothetical protein